MLHSLGRSSTIEMSTCLECLGSQRRLRGNDGNRMLQQIHRSSYILWFCRKFAALCSAFYLANSDQHVEKASTKARYLVCHPISNKWPQIHSPPMWIRGSGMRRDLLSGRGIVGWSSWKNQQNSFDLSKLPCFFFPEYIKKKCREKSWTMLDSI